MKSIRVLFLLTITFVTSCNQKKEQQLEIKTQVPIADKRPVYLEKHEDVRTDDYFWLKDRKNPEVIDYLERENDYNDKMTAHTKTFQKDLFEEMKGRIKEDDESVPYKLNGYWYITRFEKGKGYPIYSRKKESLDAPEEVLFDCNKEAEGQSYFRMVGLSISPDNSLIAFGVDTLGRRKYTIKMILR